VFPYLGILSALLYSMISLF